MMDKHVEFFYGRFDFGSSSSSSQRQKNPCSLRHTDPRVFREQRMRAFQQQYAQYAQNANSGQQLEGDLDHAKVHPHDATHPPHTRVSSRDGSAMLPEKDVDDLLAWCDNIESHTPDLYAV